MKLKKVFEKAAMCVLAAGTIAGGLLGVGRMPLSDEANICSRTPSPGQVIQTLPAPLAHAHSHNDYEHKHPLCDALNNGFNSIEADIYLVNGQLLVGHTPFELAPERNLEALYLKPLMELARQNKGHIYPQSAQNVQLLIDIKTDGNPTYQVLDALLQKYKKMLTSFSGGAVHESAVTVVISGNRPDMALMGVQPVRYAALDGKLPELWNGCPASLMPLVSDNWANQFTWDGTGEMPAQERQKLVDFVKTAHANGQKIRFWNAPDNPATWAALRAANVDYINTDHLSGLRAWLLKNDPPQLSTGSTDRRLELISHARQGNKNYQVNINKRG